jgi:uncharacterized protein (DUF1800 family)
MRNRASSWRRHFAVAVCATLGILTGGFRTASAAPQKSPSLFSVSASSTRAIVLESASLVSEPFSLNMELNFSPSDPRTRITLFGTDFELLQSEGANALSADAQDAAGTIYPLKVEYIGAVPGFAGVYMVVMRLNDQMPGNVGDVLVRVGLHGMASNRVRVAIGQIGGGPADDSAPNPAPATPPGAPNLLTLAQYQAQYTDPAFPSNADIIRFLEQATWGPKGDGSDLARVRQIGMRAYIDEQFNTAPLFIDNTTNPSLFSNYPAMTLYPVNAPTTPPCDNTCLRDNYSLYQLQKQFMVNALTGSDQLRQRVAFALHGMMVVSGRDINNSEASSYAPYLQTIDRNAFGNFRTLLFEITLNPAMGRYLDMAGNSRVSPNENYARELMQLFSIGTDLLNQDGTPILDANGNRIPTYGQAEITNLARVFTGWTIANTNVTIGGTPLSVPNYISPMTFQNNTGANGPFDVGAKTLLNGLQLPPCANCANNATNMAAYKNAELNAAIDNLFNHQNAAPYLCTQLIHHLVTSNPSPAYIGRCAAAFANNGSGVRGDMKAIITAILLDPEARGDAKTDPSYGKLREPVQFMTSLLRGFNAASDGVLVANSVFLSPNVGSLSTALGQDVFNPPTVFSYFPADYGLPGTSLFAPEFGILDTSTTYQRANFVNTLFLANGGNGIAASAPNRPAGTQTNYSAYQTMANNCTSTSSCQLVDALNTNMMHGTMSSSMRTSIINAVVAVTNGDLNTQARQRAQTAIYLVATSSQFQVQR